MREICLLVFVACMVSVIACGGQGRDRREREDERIALGQTVTSKPQPQDVIFRDFEKSWRQFISAAPELELPVIRPERPPEEPPFEPVVVSACVFSADAGGNVPQVTLSWNEPVRVSEPSPTGVRQVQAGAQETSSAPPRLRLDLGLHREAFARNYFSTALSTDRQKRFSLPANSGLAADPEAVMLTGPGLFPKLMDFRTEAIRDRDTARQFDKHTVILRDLSQGLTYTVRVSRLSGNQWSEDREFVFLTPVCPDNF